ncbi:ANTAR domain-containing protein [Oryzobacter telluris]|uniref:ANTAR domain-containing protein n=1 Tax=Oryzobacter telluris TaxID=3149179 RepID=UPI00370D9DAF
MTEDPPVYGECEYDYATASWWWSPDVYAVAGLVPDGRTPDVQVFEAMHPADRPGIEQRLAHALAHGLPMSGQCRLTDSRGRPRVIAFVGDVEHDADGAPLRLRGRAFDVTRPTHVVATEAVTAATADRAAIEQAKGALMFAYGVDDAAAFGLISRYSQRSHVKVAVVATRVVAAMAQPRHGTADPTMLELLDAVAPERDRRTAVGGGAAET